MTRDQLIQSEHVIVFAPARLTAEMLAQLPALRDLRADEIARLPRFPKPTEAHAWSRRAVAAWLRRVREQQSAVKAGAGFD